MSKFFKKISNILVILLKNNYIKDKKYMIWVWYTICFCCTFIIPLNYFDGIQENRLDNEYYFIHHAWFLTCVLGVLISPIFRTYSIFNEYTLRPLPEYDERLLYASGIDKISCTRLELLVSFIIYIILSSTIIVIPLAILTLRYLIYYECDFHSIAWLSAQLIYCVSILTYINLTCFLTYVFLKYKTVFITSFYSILFLMFPLFLSPFLINAIADNYRTLFHFGYGAAEACSLTYIFNPDSLFNLTTDNIFIFGCHISIRLFIPIYYCFHFFLQLLLGLMFFRKPINDYLDYISGKFSGVWKSFTGEGEFGYRIEEYSNGKLINSSVVENEKDLY